MYFIEHKQLVLDFPWNLNSALKNFEANSTSPFLVPPLQIPWSLTLRFGNKWNCAFRNISLSLSRLWDSTGIPCFFNFLQCIESMESHCASLIGPRTAFQYPIHQPCPGRNQKGTKRWSVLFIVRCLNVCCPQLYSVYSAQFHHIMYEMSGTLVHKYQTCYWPSLFSA